MSAYGPPLHLPQGSNLSEAGGIMDTAIALIEAPLGQAAAAKARHICVRTAGESRPSRHAHERHYVCRRRFDYRERPIGPKLEATKFFLAIGMLIIDLV
jgi:hypothetical protein